MSVNDWKMLHEQPVRERFCTGNIQLTEKTNIDYYYADLLQSDVVTN